MRKRTFIQAGAAMAAAALPLHSIAQQRERVRYGLSFTPMSALGVYAYPATALKYWYDEGLDVEVVTSQGSGQIMQMLASNAVDIGTSNPEPYVVAKANQNLRALSVAAIMPVSTWDLGVKPDSPIKTYADLKGKTVGVASLASGGVYILKARATEAGLNPEKDYTLLPIGLGASANEAYASNKVDAMLFWRSGFTTLENVGAKFRYLPRSAWEDSIYAFLAVGAQDFVTKRPETVAKFLRGVAKSMQFGAGSPRAAAMVFEKAYPETVSRTVDPAVNFENNVRLINATMTDAGIGSPRFDQGPGRVWLKQADAEWTAIQDFLVKSALIKAPVPLEQLYTDRFTADANRFDHSAIIQTAKAYDIKYK